MKHTLKPLFILISCSFFSFSGNAQSFDSIFDKEIISRQQELIAKLTGQVPLNEITSLAVRNSFKERKLTVSFLVKSLKAIGLTPQKHNYRLSNEFFFLDLFFRPYRGTNVFAVIPATIKTDEYIILGGHYDSEPKAPGADDNASGIALTYGVAYKIKQLKIRKKNIMIVFFDQEEENEIGSKAFAKKIKREGQNVHSVHITDMVGWDKNNDYAVTLSPPIKNIKQIYSSTANRLSIPLIDSKMMSSDHKSFYDLGFDAVLISEDFKNKDYNPYYHTEKDQYNTINFNYLASNTRLVYEVIKHLIEN
ncbi:M20/M25/M40 family metallo-hydrolase [Flavobacteriaceae bacterium R38]|nr:M20/M25/M40 family metallo-hydrolase [Flavobacteriaceae bacterium R38]